MPRRASSGISIGQIIGISAAIAGFLVAAFLLYRIVGGGMLGSSHANVGSAEELKLVDYLENANSLRGNVYRVAGTVEERIKWTPDKGRLISLDVSQGSTKSPVPVLVPDEFSQTNIERGAEMSFLVKVGQGGLLIAEKLDQI